MQRHLWLDCLVAAALLIAWQQGALGQTAPSGPAAPVLDPPAQLMLIRNTLALVNHGNLTGNYTVLRDLASPRFRQRNTAADLAATFAGLREQRLDLSPVLVIQPQLSQATQVVGDRLQMAGLFPTRPQAVHFALAFQQVDGGWMLDEVSLRVAPAEERPPGAAALTTPGATAARPPPSYVPLTR